MAEELAWAMVAKTDDDKLSFLRVLIVDDVAPARMLLKSILWSFGIKNISEASDGGQALRIVRARALDLVITDLRMKPMDGLEFTRHLREPGDGSYGSLPVLMLTAYSERNLVKEAIAAGIDDFLTKPIVRRALEQKLLSMFDRSRPLVNVNDYGGPDRRRISLAAENLRRRMEDEKRRNAEAAKTGAAPASAAAAG